MEAQINNVGKKPKNNLPILTGFLVLALFVLFLPVVEKEFSKFSNYMSAAISTASVTVSNILPVASSTSLNGESDITLTEGTTTHVVATGTVTDSNGCKDLTSVVVKIYKGLLANCTATNYDTCYISTDSNPANDVSCTGGTDTDYVITGTNHNFQVQYYAEPGTWKATVIPSDHVGAGTSDTSSGTTVRSTTALNVTATISYGTVANGADSTGDHKAVVLNTGNTAIDFDVSGQDLTCNTFGSIPVGDQQYGISSFSYGTGTALTTSAANINASMPAPTYATYATDTFDTYWQITIPYAVSGLCSGDVTFMAGPDL
jgi:hypothetical protein